LANRKIQYGSEDHCCWCNLNRDKGAAVGDFISEKEVEALWKDIKGIPCPFRGVRAKFIRKKGEIFNGRILKKRRRGEENICALMFSRSPAFCFAENGNTPCLESCEHFNTTAGRRVVAKIMIKFINGCGG